MKMLKMFSPDEPVATKRKSHCIGKLKIEDCKLNIYGCRFAPSFFKVDKIPSSVLYALRA